MDALQKIIQLCTQFLDGKITTEHFVETYEAYMFEYGDQVANEQHLHLDAILEAVTYFDSGSDREDDENFIDEPELRDIVSKSLEKITTDA
jgi:hypothetical protein